MKKLFNNHGFVESGIMVLIGMILGTAGAIGKLYSSGTLINSNFMVVGAALSAYSQMPHVKRDFREKRYVEICESKGGESCLEQAKGIETDKLLSYIKDNKENEAFYAPKATKRNGGGLRSRILEAQM